MPHKECAFFLAANSRHGFVSFFEDFLTESFERDVYMLKGGPGCGKSTLIRRVCQPLARDGEQVETIYCSSDPDSLDGMVLSDRLAVLDATAPHASETKSHNKQAPAKRIIRLQGPQLYFFCLNCRGSASSSAILA